MKCNVMVGKLNKLNGAPIIKNGSGPRIRNASFAMRRKPMLVECSCGWTGSSSKLLRHTILKAHVCPDCKKVLTIRNTDEWKDHYPETEDEDDDE